MGQTEPDRGARRPGPGQLGHQRVLHAVAADAEVGPGRPSDSSPGPRRQQGLGGPEILLGIHSDDGLVGLEHVDRNAGLQEP